MSFPYWRDETGFVKQSALLGNIFRMQEEHHDRGEQCGISLESLADDQRAALVGCMYLIGSRIDSNFGFGSKYVGLHHAVLPTDYVKAIAPAFHGEHSELTVCTHGEITFEYANSLSEDAKVEVVVLRPGEFIIVERHWPHRISLAPLRAALSETRCRTVAEIQSPDQLSAGFMAMKMGILGTKTSAEDMTQWPDSPGHPLISNWKNDQRLLDTIRSNASDCAVLHLPVLKREQENFPPGIRATGE